MHSGGLSWRPVYIQLRDVLVERIAKGDWKPGQIIPNEGLLAREFGVSVGTMRKALDLLESEHVVTRRQGRGTFVNDMNSARLMNRFTSLRDLDGNPLVGELTATRVERTTSSETECARLELPQGNAVLRFQRTRVHRNHPFLYEEVSLPAALFPNLSERIPPRIVTLAKKFGLLLGKAEERVSVGGACERAAMALRVARGTPVVLLDRVVRALDGRPVEWRVGQCHTRENYYLASIS
jgi:GntR family transcriptional regulator